jgi:hypothetical protein
MKLQLFCTDFFQNSFATACLQKKKSVIALSSVCVYAQIMPLQKKTAFSTLKPCMHGLLDCLIIFVDFAPCDFLRAWAGGGSP